MNDALRFNEVQDHLEIRNLLARIAHLADVGTPEEYLECFTEAAVWELSSAEGLPLDEGVIRGHAALHQGVMERRATGIQGPGTFTAHAVSTTNITVNGDVAQARSLFMYYTGIDRTPTLAAVGRYTDLLERSDDGRWLLAYRNITRA